MTASTIRTQTCPPSAPTIERGPATLAARATAIARRAWRTYWERRARRATTFILHSLDERTLRDIGIGPGEIESCVYGGNDRRRRYHDQWPWRSQ